MRATWVKCETGSGRRVRTISELRRYATLLAAGAAGSAPLTLQLRKAGAADLAVSGDWTPAHGGAAGTDDVQVSIDGAAFVNSANAPTYTQGRWQLILTAAELTGKSILVRVVDAATKAVDDDEYEIHTFGNASAMYPDAYATLLLGTPAAGAGLAGDVALVQADTDNIQTRLPAALTGGRMDANVGAMANGVITAAVIATDAIDADALAADALAEIANGLLDLANAIEAGVSLRGAQRVQLAALAGKLSGAGTGSEVFRNAVADTKSRITATVDGAGNRTAVTTDQT